MSLYVLWFIGTALCLAGFLHPPKSLFELLRPRFVVPLAIWFATFAQVVVFANNDTAWDNYASYRAGYGTDALGYIILCLLAFWAGYVLPAGRRVARPLEALDTSFEVSRRGLQRFGVGLILIGLALFVLFSGMRIFGISGDPLLTISPTIVGPVSTLIYMGVAIGSAIVGLSWPPRGERTIFSAPWRLVLLLAASTPGMANFTRGAGLPVLVAATAFSFRNRRLGWVFFGALVWTMLCSHTGLYGRAVYGHYAGVGAFADVFFHESIWDWRQVFNASFGAADAFTPLCVEMRASAGAHNVGLLSPMNWLLFQIPIPRGLGILPDWTADYTLFLGGAGSWGYLVTMFGDTHGSLGAWGALVFAVWGVLFRMVDTLASRTQAGPGLRLQPFVLLLLTSYYALAMGLFNSNRAMVVAFFFPLYLIVFVLLVRKVFFARPPAGAGEGPAGAEEYHESAATAPAYAARPDVPA